ncbi:peptidoglycan editing factor PgeF [Erythrobacter sp.]|uniref:peptidoglycan editing factor PgeF n=1 Tax=Erythrobacter sp. TaxID=1042 RepID=UPI001425DDE1|nr:peptidoglycan editing factor PgeF [Erythrobacter sp.]QIQ87644.1 MAG: peptidoglycan editing factor PgeF [Erythrobacter sp.]
MTRFAIERAEALDGVPHGFFGSAGGAHQFGYGGPGEAQAIAALRAEAAEAIRPGAVLVAPHQVHSPDAVTVTEGWEDAAEGRPVADAVVTDRPGLALGIVTADCAPVLLADAEAGVIGAAHAGWRGAKGGVIANTLAAMEALGANPATIAAAIGPTIAQQSYEVDEPFRAHFAAADEPHFAPAPPREGTPRWHFDLPGYVAARLTQAGVRKINYVGGDTFSHQQSYHSYRRASSLGEPGYGRQISVIALP